MNNSILYTKENQGYFLVNNRDEYYVVFYILRKTKIVRSY